jgi:hypothetical protein
LTDEIFSPCGTWQNTPLQQWLNCRHSISPKRCRNQLENKNKNKINYQVVRVQWRSAAARASGQDWWRTFDHEWSQRRNARISDRYVIRIRVGADILTVALIGWALWRRLLFKKKSTNAKNIFN